MQIIEVTKEHLSALTPLVADFRVTLKSFKGISSSPNLDAAQKEIEEYLDAHMPVYTACADGKLIGYAVLRVDEPVVWLESIYVCEEHRGSGAADLLLERAEALAHTFGEETIYHYVHPNNQRMIGFLRKHGYTVLNLIEIRKPYPGETLHQRIPVGDNQFDY